MDKSRAAAWVLGMMPVPCRFNGIKIEAPEFDRFTLFRSEVPARCRDPLLPLLSSNALQYPCDFVVSFLWLAGNPVIVAEQRLTSAGGLAFLWRFPWLRSDSYIEMQHALGQHAKPPAAAHTFLFVQEQHMLNLSHSLGPLATFGPLWGDATLATLFWAVIQRFGVHQDSHLWKVDKKQRERCRRNGPPQSWMEVYRRRWMGVIMDVHSKLGTWDPSKRGLKCWILVGNYRFWRNSQFWQIPTSTGN